jgi:hypothetical protein
MLLAVLNKLKSERVMRNKEILVITGGVVEADELIRLLIKLGVVEYSPDALVARPPVDNRFSKKQIADIEDYVLGAIEAAGFRKLMEVLDPIKSSVKLEELGIDVKKVQLAGPDAQTVQRFVKGYIDVGELASQRGESEAK